MTASSAADVPFRVGNGYDAHRLTPGRPLRLGGVDVPHSAGLAAHSDGDVALHALIDALFGAAGLGDIGLHFPDTDAAFKGVDSRELLRESVRRIAERGYRVVNADLTIVAERPKLRPHIDAMVACVAADLDVDRSRVNIKATTTEKMGFTGREEGIAAFAVALLAQ